MLGILSGAIIGLFFHQENWLGGYHSWCRCMVRLGHISFFGIALLNLAFASSRWMLGLEGEAHLSSYLMIAGAILMPTVCYLSAWHKAFRHLFFMPVICILTAVLAFLPWCLK